MPKVFEAQHLAEAHLVNGLLQAEGINAEVRGDTLFTTLGTGTDVPGVLPSVWVSNPAIVARALAIVAKFAKGESFAQTGAQSWQCPKCQEIHEPQFSACWNCGTTKAASVQA